MNSARQWCEFCQDEHGMAYLCGSDPYSRGNQRIKKEKEDKENLYLKVMGIIMPYFRGGDHEVKAACARALVKAGIKL